MQLRICEGSDRTKGIACPDPILSKLCCMRVMCQVIHRILYISFAALRHASLADLGDSVRRARQHPTPRCSLPRARSVADRLCHHTLWMHWLARCTPLAAGSLELYAGITVLCTTFQDARVPASLQGLKPM